MPSFYVDRHGRISGKRYCYATKKRIPISREEMKADRMIDASLDQLRSFYDAKYPQGRVGKIVSPKPQLVMDLLEGYLQSTEGNKNPKTLLDHKRYLLSYAIPFFTQMSPMMPSPHDWYKKSGKLKSFILETGGTEAIVTKTNSALRAFIAYLRTQHGDRFASVVEPPLVTAPRGSKKTPLTKMPTPEDILAWEEGIEDRYSKLLGLIGYFSQLRPQEMYALTKTDFVLGSVAKQLECCKAMSAVGLFDQMAVNVSKQRSQDDCKNKTTSLPKTTSSLAHAAIFDKEAAKRIFLLLKDMEQDEPLFPGHNDAIRINHWNKYRPSGMTIKDLRRSSLYYLGHWTPLGDSAHHTKLQKQARHAEFKMTQKYLRRADEVTTQSQEQWETFLEDL